MLDKIDKIASIIQAFTITLLSFFAFTQFRYKHDAETRKIYLKNYKKMQKLIKQYQINEYTAEMHQELKEITQEAKIFFPKELANAIEELRGDIILKRHYELKKEENRATDEDYENRAIASNIIFGKSENLYKLYKKYLINNIWGDFKDFWKNKWQKSFTKSLIDKIFN